LILVGLVGAVYLVRIWRAPSILRVYAILFTLAMLLENIVESRLIESTLPFVLFAAIATSLVITND
jgi:hypothetical protein